MSKLSIIGAVASSKSGTSSSPDRNITSAAAQNPQSFDFGTAFATVQTSLPSQVTYTLSDQTSIPLNTTWAQGSYNASAAGTYDILGTPTTPLPVGITNTANVVAHINVTVNAAITYDVYVDVSRPDDSGNGLTLGTAKKTIPAAITVAQGLGGARTIKASSGTYQLSARISWPVNISFVGAGIDVTTIKGDESLNAPYVQGSFIYGFDRALIRMESGSATNGNQTLRDFTLDCSKISNSALRGQNVGINVLNRSNVVLQNIKCRKAYFSGFYLNNVTSCRVTGCTFIDNSYGEDAFATGNVMWGDSTDLEIDNNNINEGFGNGAKAFAGDSGYVCLRLKFHHNTVSVIPHGQWGGGTAPNIAFEQWADVGSFTRNCEIYNNYFDNNVSLVMNAPNTDGTPTIHFYNNVCDMVTRANNDGYCIELSLNYVEIDHNYLIGGADGTMINFQNSSYPQYGNFNIHHNVIRAPQAGFPSGILRSTNKGFRDVNFYNNTVHVLPGQNQQVLVIATYNAGSSQNINIRNNVFIDESTQNSQWGENALVQVSGTVQNLIVSHNYFQGIPVGNISGGTYSNNTVANPQITKSGVAPDPYYRPLPGSPVIEAGVNVGLPFTGTAPTIGAYELATVSNSGDIVSVESTPAVSIASGVPWASVNASLPTTRVVTLNTAAQVTLSVVWAQGTYNSAVDGTYNIVGTLTLVSGVTNTAPVVTAAVAITVTTATVEFTDSFNRGSLGSNYTVQGNAVATLNGSDMTLTATGAPTNTDRILRNTWDDTIDNARISLIFSPSIISSTSVGEGIGFQNAVNPNPNKGVFVSYDTSTGVNAGRLSIQSGDGTLNNGAFIIRTSSAGVLPVVLNRRYEMILTRELVGADAVFMAIITDLVTEVFVTTTWTEPGAVSMTYNQQITIYHLGGTAVVEDETAYDLDDVTSTVLVDDIFDRALLAPWAEIDNASQLTVTVLNPYVRLVSGVFAASRLIAHGTPLGTALNSWKMTVDFTFVSGSGGSFMLGTKNQPVSPNVNRALFVRVDQSVGKVSLFTGDGNTNDDAYTQQHISSGTMTFTNGSNYRAVLERTYSGSGNSSYLVTVFLISSPGTTITSNYTWTGAPEQALYASTKWSIPVMNTTADVKHVLIEQL